MYFLFYNNKKNDTFLLKVCDYYKLLNDDRDRFIALSKDSFFELFWMKINMDKLKLEFVYTNNNKLIESETHFKQVIANKKCQRIIKYCRMKKDIPGKGEIIPKWKIK